MLSSLDDARAGDPFMSIATAAANTKVPIDFRFIIMPLFSSVVGMVSIDER
jgi:hypothetical protein